MSILNETGEFFFVLVNPAPKRRAKVFAVFACVVTKKTENKLIDCRMFGAYLGRAGCGGRRRREEEHHVNVGRYNRASAVSPALKVWYLQVDALKVRCTSALSLWKATGK